MSECLWLTRRDGEMEWQVRRTFKEQGGSDDRDQPNT